MLISHICNNSNLLVFLVSTSMIDHTVKRSCLFSVSCNSLQRFVVVQSVSSHVVIGFPILLVPDKVRWIVFFQSVCLSSFSYLTYSVQIISFNELVNF